MKNKVLKISVVILLIMTLTMTNFIFLGSSLISYAADTISTNHKNIEFDAYFKDSSGQRTTTLERTADMQDIALYLAVNVNKEGFFTGQVELQNSNFNIVSSESEFVNKVSGNTIYFNQLNVGTNAEIEVKVKPIDNEVMNISMLDCQSELILTGIYRDNTEKDIDIDATRTVTMRLVEGISVENVKNELEVITSKIVKISGEDKRVVQFSLNMGLKDNNYPIKEIYTKINVPKINGISPEVIRDVHLNTMSAFDYKYENDYVEITMKNEETQNDDILWRKQGEENVILTYIYDADVELKDINITSEAKITLQNGKALTSNSNVVTLSNEEIDSTIEVTAKNSEESIYKGKLYSNINKQYTSETVLDVNLANIEEYISIKEESSRYIFDEGEIDSNIYYNRTVISKKDFETIFGNEGTIRIYNENNELLATIASDTESDANGNIVIDYTGREPKGIEIRTSSPITEGTLTFTHTKTITASSLNTVKSAKSIATKIVYGYNNYNETDIAIKGESYTTGIEAETEMMITLNETATEARLEINRNTLSTILANDIEMKLILKTDEESKDLYKNPTFTIELPEQVESIQINSINLLYEEELKIANYTVDGRYITIQMEGEQTSYKSQSVEGANIIINATINVNRTSIAKPETINVAYTNAKANAYANNEEIGRISKDIAVVAPKDVTVINSIQALNVETIGEEEKTNVSLQRGTDARQMEVSFEIINNNEENVDNVYMLGTFPTRTEENNIDISVIEGINIENGSVYYTENEEATPDLGNTENGWTESITNPTAVKKYLVVMDNIAQRTAVSGSYTIEVPENLEYNQTATEGYEVTYTKEQTRTENTVTATEIAMETGVGPKVETKLTATVAGKELADTDTVKDGEVIKYKIQVSNVGSEDVSNITVKGMIPEGTKLVEPVERYEYTGTSYYKEVEAEKFEEIIESLPIGDVAYIEYEVMVSSDDGITVENIAEINYLDVIQETNVVTLKTEAGNLTSMVKRITDRNTDLYEDGTVEYYGIVKNNSTETINDVKVKTNKSDNLEVSSVELITGLEETEINEGDLIYINSEQVGESLIDPTDESDEQDKIKEADSEVTEEIEYSDEINIGTLAPGETKVLCYTLIINPMAEDQNSIEFSITAMDGGKEYKSNKWEDIVHSFDIDMTMQSNTESKYVKSGDIITYIITAKNNSTSETLGLAIQDEIPSQLTVTNVIVNGEQKATDGEYINYVEVQEQIPANGEMTVQIETIVDYSEARMTAETITNKAVATVYGDEIATTADLNHIIEADVEEEPNTGNNEGETNGGTTGGTTGDTTGGTTGDTTGGQTGNEANGSQIISGLAWYDENGNGKKDKEETSLEGITVKLLNVDTNELVKVSSGVTLSATTDQNGNYVLDNIANGRYIVIFEYNQTQYSLTKYKAEGISEAENSDASLNELLIDGTRQQVAATDIINIDNENISDISIGLIELQNFDLKLDKYISRISIQNSAGTTVREYNNTTTAKVELDAKTISGSIVIVEYSIVVTNVGEVAGYARSIVDYMPSDLEFNSELNKDWYENNKSLYTSALENELINPGESKTVTLTLTRTMGEDNLVTRNNAEIQEAYNDLGLEDSNSTPGNNASGENDMGSADIIISIRTGGVIYMTIGILIAVIIVAGTISGIVVKRRNSKSEEE